MRPASGVLGQLEVLHALVLRETRTRFGRHHLGYLWALFEPLMWIGTFWGMYYVLGRGAPDGMEPVAFLTTGLAPFLLFRHIYGRAASAITSNRGLLFYPQIQPLDLVWARAVLEFATMFMVFAVLIGGIHIIQGTALHVDDFLTFVFGFTSAGFLGMGFGLTMTGLGVFFPALERIQGVLTRPLIWVTGLFFTANSLPASARHIFLYNPLLHSVEFTRTGWFHEYDARYASAEYLMTWIICLGFLGMTLERVARRRLGDA